MSWYAGEDRAKSVREVVIGVPGPSPVDSKFGMLFLAEKYHCLRTNCWSTGFFRLDDDGGPFLMLRADGNVERLRDQPFRVAFCFYRMKAGALIAVFVDFPGLEIPGAPSAPYVLFEMIRGVDLADERERIGAAISRGELHVCFAEGDGPGEDLPDGGWSGSPINASFDVVVDLDPACREALDSEWRALLDYHDSMPGSDFQASVQQMQAENPLTHNPIIDFSAPGKRPAAGRGKLGRGIGVANEDGQTVWAFRTGQPLPATWTHDFSTTVMLHGGSSGNALVVRVVEGENDKAHLNVHLCDLVLAAIDISTAIPRGALITITIEISESEQMVVYGKLPDFDITLFEVDRLWRVDLRKHAAT